MLLVAMTLRLDDGESEALRRRAELEGRSMQEVARHAVRDYIERPSRRELIDRVLDSALPRYAAALAADPRLQVLVIHGLYDIVTPYFASKMILDQMPPALAGRARLLALPGGHMFYTRDASRLRLQQEGAALVEAATKP